MYQNIRPVCSGLMGGLVLKLELALFYRDIKHHSQHTVPTSPLHTARQIPEADSIIDKEPGWTWSHQWRDSRSEYSLGFWFRLRYSRSESPQTTKALTLLEIPESTARFGLPSHQTLTGTNRAGACGDQCLVLMRSLGLAESHYVHLRRGVGPVL